MKKSSFLNIIWVCLLALIVNSYSVPVKADNVISLEHRKKTVPDSLLEKIFLSAAQYADLVKEYKSDLYLKGNFKVHHRNRIMKYLPAMFRLEKGVNSYVHESLSYLHYTAPDIYDRKMRALVSTFPNSRSETFDIINYINFNIYSPSVMGDKILSPLSASSQRHYRYEFESVSYIYGAPVYQINVIPRYRSTQLLEGSIWISSWDWTVKVFDLKGKYDLMGFRMYMRMGDTEETKYLPTLFHLNLDFKFLRNHTEMNYTGWMRYNSVKFKSDDDKVDKRSKKERLNLSRSYTLTCDTSKLIVDRDSFNRLRPIPLEYHEDTLYAAFDRRVSQRKLEAAIHDSVRTKKHKNLVFWGQIGDALISSYNIDVPKIGSIRCSPLINPVLVSYSHRQGVSYKQVFKFNKLFYNGKHLRIVPQIGYNFTKKEFYAKADMKFVYNPAKNASFELNAGNGNRIYSSVVLDQLKNIPDSTFSFDGLNLDYFKDIYLNLSHNIEIINGLRLWTGLSMHWRYTKSSPEVAERVRSHYNSFAPRIRIEWTPNMRYYMNGRRKINVGSKYPTFCVDYERGIKILHNSGEYERIEMAAEQVIRLRKVHSLAYRLASGFFTNQKTTYFVDYVNFAYRNLPEGWNDDIGGTFQMLDSRWYNSSRHYFSGNFTFESPFIFLYPVGNLLSFIQKERIYGGILFMPHLNPYFELGYGIGTHVFDAGIFIGNERGKFTSVGFKFTFELFND